MVFWTAEQRHNELDGVRGIAILLTIACNTLIVPDSGAVAHAWYIFADAGWVGVQLFFVLSGFLITGILIDTKGNPNYFRNFYARRALRILPVYFLALAFISAVLWLKNETLPIHPLCYWLFVSNYCIAGAGHWIDGYLGVTWSLAVEEHFYLVWPVLVAVLPKRRLLAVTCCVIGASLALRWAMSAYGASGLSIYVGTLTRLDGLAAGALLAVLLRHQLPAENFALWSRRTLAIGLMTMVVAALSVGSFRYDNPMIQTVGYTGLTLASSGLILLLVSERDRSQALRRAMRWPPLVALGFYSYAIYLYHVIVYYFLLKLPPFKVDALLSYPGGPVTGQLVITGVVSVLAFVLAVASYHVFEKRFLDLRRYFPRQPGLVVASLVVKPGV